MISGVIIILILVFLIFIVGTLIGLAKDQYDKAMEIEDKDKLDKSNKIHEELEEKHK